MSYSNYELYNFDPCNLSKLPEHHNESQMVRESEILYIKQVLNKEEEDLFELKILSKFDFRGFMLQASHNGKEIIV